MDIDKDTRQAAGYRRIGPGRVRAGGRGRRRDLATINVAVVILGKGDGFPNNHVPCASGRHLFRKEEAWIVCREAPQAAPDVLNTRELATLCLVYRLRLMVQALD